MPTLDNLARTALRMQLVRHEGVRLFPYRDLVGKLTIGVGHNLDDRGITARQAYYILDDDIDDTIVELCKAFPAWFPSLDAVRQAAIVNVSFNLGVERLGRFSRAIAALEARNYDVAAAELLASRWAIQVGYRARELAAQVRTGAWPLPDHVG